MEEDNKTRDEKLGCNRCRNKLTKNKKQIEFCEKIKANETCICCWKFKLKL